jgi:hypothetical protein
MGPSAIADTLRAFKAAGVAPSAAAKEAMAKAVVKEAPRLTPKNIADVLEGYADLGEAPPREVMDAMTAAVEREVGLSVQVKSSLPSLSLKAPGFNP